LLSARALTGNGILTLALLLVPAVVLSHLSHLNLYDARRTGLAMAKVGVYITLIAALVTSPDRLRLLLRTMVGSAGVMVALAVMQHHGLLNLPALSEVEQRSREAGGPDTIVRLCGLGIFNDPNDLSLILVVALGAAAYLASEPHRPGMRALFACLIVLFGYGLVLTHSRGGLMAALSALLTFMVARGGWRHALPLMGLVALALLATLGRQLDLRLDDPQDSFQGRVELWDHSLEALRRWPLFGAGAGAITDLIGQVCHNSYLHAFAELGLVGGTAFLGVYLLALGGLRRAAPTDPGLARARPYLLAVTAGYAAGLLSLSRCYTVPALLVPAIGAAYLGLCSSGGATALPRLTWRCAGRLAGVGILFVAATQVFVRIAQVRP
jgi:O-antigen ligase